MAKLIFKFNEKGGFTVVRNELVNDKKLSAKSKGVMLYLLSKQNLQTEWESNIKSISENFTDGYDSIKSALVELEKNHYLDRVKFKNKVNGQFTTYYVVWNNNKDNPNNHKYLQELIKNTQSGKSTGGQPTGGKSANNNKEVKRKNKKLYKKEFDIWYSLYDKKVTKKQATSYWDRNITSEQLVDKIMNHTRMYVQNTDKQYRKDPHSYLLNECWEDEIIIKEKSQADREKELLADAEERMHKKIEKQNEYWKKAEAESASPEEISDILGKWK